MCFLQRNPFLLLVTLLFVLYFGTESKCQDIPTAECVDNKEDFSKYGWSTIGKYSYASNSSDLPGQFKDKEGLGGNGIFYITSAENRVFVKKGESVTDTRQAYIYLKYYAHVEYLFNEQAYVSPTLTAEESIRRYLELSGNFAWKEDYFAINMDQIFQHKNNINVGVYQFSNFDYFFVDKIILAHGTNITRVSQILELCKLSNSTTTTTTTTTTVTTEEAIRTTTPGEGPCCTCSASSISTPTQSGLTTQSTVVTTNGASLQISSNSSLLACIIFYTIMVFLPHIK